MNWDGVFAHRVGRFQGSAVREMFHWAQLPDMISLSAGSPAPELFPVDAFRRAANQVLDQDAAGALQYGITEGYAPLREWLAEHLKSKGISVSTDQILITTGSQQAMDLLVRVLFDRGDLAVIERPTFIGTLQALDTCEPEYLSARMDGDGLIVNELARQLDGKRPKLICAQPNFQNPSGVSMTLERRRALARLAGERGIPLVEDDPYSELLYEGEPLPSIKSFDEAGVALYLGSFSKILMPGLRIGWVAGPEIVLQKMAVVKQSNDLHTDGFVQRVVNLMVRSGFLPEHIARLRQLYKERRDAMLEAIGQHFPPDAKYTRPRGGLFVWVELPEGIDCGAFMRAAVERRVLFPPGAGFFRDGTGQDTMRLNFSNQPPDKIREGVKRLGRVIKEHLAKR